MEEKQFYRIKEVAEITGETASTLRYWEDEFTELNPKRTQSGRRLYTSKDLEIIKVIKFLLRTKGMHITMAKQQLHTNRHNVSTRSAALDDLLEVRDSLKTLLKSLNKRIGD